jgi:Late exocytosis, associated with Golgi transport/Calcium-dependent channel, 7TM region, putative phosphate/Cytosolic domain of 10TM putative phosphate transporter
MDQAMTNHSLPLHANVDANTTFPLNDTSLQENGSFNFTAAPTNSPTYSSSGVAPTTSADTALLVRTIQVYGTTYVVFMALFCLLRIRRNKLYNIRSWVPRLESKIMQSNYGLISWMWKVFHVDEDRILESCGMDALCFIRVLRLGRKLALVGCFHACWLIPVYATAEDSQETAYLTDKLAQISTAHVPTGSKRFLATILCAYSVFGYAMWLISRELEWYTTLRHTFLSQRRPRNYVIYVAGIPKELRSAAKLAEFFHQVGATTSVLEAHVTLACPELESLVAQREDVKNQLQHEKALEEIHGVARSIRRVNLPNWKGHKRHGSSGLVSTFNSVDRLETKLRQLTKDIALAYQNIERSNGPFSLEQHPHHVMSEIEDLRRAERAQNISNRERVYSGHGEVEEIFHVPKAELELTTTNSNQQPDKFSQVAEAFFFGDLNPELLQEQQGLLQMQEEQCNDPDPLRPVTIHSPKNSLCSVTCTWSGSLGGEHNVDDGPVSPSSAGAPPLSPAHNAYSSKSTVSTITGTSDAMANASTSQASLESGTSGGESNGTTPSNKRRQTEEVCDVMVGLEGPDRDEDQHSESSASGTETINQSKSRIATGTLRRVSWGVKKLSGGVTKTVVNVGTGVGDITKQSLRVAGDIGLSNIQKVGELGVKEANKAILQAAELGVANINTIRASAAAVVPMVMAHSEGKPLEAGFVVFRDLYSTQAALQMLHHNVAGVMRVEEAPGPNEIYWRNVGLPGTAKRTGHLLSLGATVALCLFWTVPVSFIASLTEVNSLKESIPALADAIEKHPELEKILAMIAPLLLLMLQDLVLPQFLLWFATWEGHISSTAMEAAVFLKYASFVVSAHSSCTSCKRRIAVRISTV